MLILVAGLVLFLGVHSARIVAEPTRQRFIAARGVNAWKGLHAIASLIGFVMIIVGYRAAPDIWLWFPPAWLRHVTLLLMAVAFVLLAASYVPGNRVKAAVGHPMVIGVKVWAFAHLLANGALASVVLFGAFLVWAIADLAAARRRDRRSTSAHGTSEVDVPGHGSAADGMAAGAVAAGGLGATIATVGLGLVAWIVFAGWLHRALIGVSPIAVGGG